MKDQPTFATIVLASGSSTRFGDQDKLLAPLASDTVLGRTLTNTRGATSGEFIVVCRPDTGEVQDIARSSGARVVMNHQAAIGMGTSIAAGVAAIERSPDGIFICLGDMPFLETSDFEGCIEHFEMGTEICRPIYHGQPGHPVLFGACYFNELLNLDDDNGAKRILKAHPESLRLLPSTNPGVIRDIDKPTDLPVFSAD
jgi:molybdenum cofactor cytidylyltransferase